MGLFNYIEGLVFGEREVSEPAASEPTPPVPNDEPLTYLDVCAPLESAMSVAAVYCCVSLLSESVAQLPLRYERLKGDVYVPVPGRLNYLLTVQPNEWTTAVDFWSAAESEVLLEGNAYIVPVRVPGEVEPVRLVLCTTGSVAHDTVNNRYTVKDYINGISETYEEWEIIHLKGRPNNLNPKTGMSVLAYAFTTLGIAHAGDKTARDTMASGGLGRGIVSNDTSRTGYGEYASEDLSGLSDDLEKDFRRGKHIVSVPGAAQYTQMAQSAADMQMLQMRSFTVKEICRFFRVNPSMVFEDTSNNYKSVEMATSDFLSKTLNPILLKIEQELLRKLVLAPELAGKYRFRFDRSELNACDLESRRRVQGLELQSGICTVNELRRIENKPPVEGGDSPLVSANLKPIGELGGF